MVNFFINIAGAFIFFPFIIYVVLFVILKITTKNHTVSFNSSLYVTTLCLLFFLENLVHTIWTTPFMYFLLLTVCVLAFGYTLVYKYIKKEIIYRRLFQGFVRVLFLVLSASYIVLMFVGVAKSILKGL